jgi:hypothetical protein
MRRDGLVVFDRPGHIGDRRFIVAEDEKPFFYLGDTAWELFHRLNSEEAEYYIRDRSAKGFTVIQAVVLAEFGGLNIPNAYGDLPFRDNDISLNLMNLIFSMSTTSSTKLTSMAYM